MEGWEVHLSHDRPFSCNAYVHVGTCFSAEKQEAGVAQEPTQTERVDASRAATAPGSAVARCLHGRGSPHCSATVPTTDECSLLLQPQNPNNPESSKTRLVDIPEPYMVYTCMYLYI